LKCLNNNISSTLWLLFIIFCRHLKFLFFVFAWASSLEVSFKRSAEEILPIPEARDGGH
jgi:hypothetical protein